METFEAPSTSTLNFPFPPFEIGNYPPLWFLPLHSNTSQSQCINSFGTFSSHAIQGHPIDWETCYFGIPSIPLVRYPTHQRIYSTLHNNRWRWNNPNQFPMSSLTNLHIQWLLAKVSRSSKLDLSSLEVKNPRRCIPYPCSIRLFCGSVWHSEISRSHPQHVAMVLGSCWLVHETPIPKI